MRYEIFRCNNAGTMSEPRYVDAQDIREAVKGHGLWFDEVGVQVSTCTGPNGYPRNPVVLTRDEVLAIQAGESELLADAHAQLVAVVDGLEMTPIRSIAKTLLGRWTPNELHERRDAYTAIANLLRGEARGRAMSPRPMPTEGRAGYVAYTDVWAAPSVGNPPEYEAWAMRAHNLAPVPLEAALAELST